MPANERTQLMPAIPEDTPRAIVSRPSTGDMIFRTILRVSGWSVFVIVGLILTFLIVRAAKAFHLMGFDFLTTQNWYQSTARSTSASRRSCRSAS